MTNRFIWTDLSALNLQQTKRFYTRCLGWEYRVAVEDYWLAQKEHQSVAGLYPMPEKFRHMGMPSFWMSYTLVENIETAVRDAEAHGGRIEVPPEPAPGGGRVALIRDPAGAGFTCYEGNALGKPVDENQSRRWHELHVSDLERVESFYREVFGWNVTETSNADRYLISDSLGETFAGIRVTSNEIKGDKEYWGVYFKVNDLPGAIENITQVGGEIVWRHDTGSGPAVLGIDPQGAAFHLVQDKNVETNRALNSASNPKWRAMLGLGIVALAVMLEANWIWGLLFLLWVIPDLKTGTTHFLELVERQRNPVTYWLIVGTWVLLSVYLFAEWLWPT